MMPICRSSEQRLAQATQERHERAAHNLGARPDRTGDNPHHGPTDEACQNVRLARADARRETS